MGPGLYQPESLRHSSIGPKAPGEGTGLGLWVSASIIEQHGGQLRAENRPEGGAAFVIEMPLAGDGESAPTGK